MDSQEKAKRLIESLTTIISFMEGNCGSHLTILINEDDDGFNGTIRVMLRIRDAVTNFKKSLYTSHLTFEWTPFDDGFLDERTSRILEELSNPSYLSVVQKAESYFACEDATEKKRMQHEMPAGFDGISVNFYREFQGLRNSVIYFIKTHLRIIKAILIDSSLIDDKDLNHINAETILSSCKNTMEYLCLLRERVKLLPENPEKTNRITWHELPPEDVLLSNKWLLECCEDWKQFSKFNLPTVDVVKDVIEQVNRNETLFRQATLIICDACKDRGIDSADVSGYYADYLGTKESIEDSLKNKDPDDMLFAKEDICCQTFFKDLLMCLPYRDVAVDQLILKLKKESKQQGSNATFNKESESDELKKTAASNEAVTSSKINKLIPPIEETKTEHSDDFSSVIWYGIKHPIFNKTQALVVGLLWKEWEKGTPTLSDSTIKKVIGSANERFRLRHTFRNHPAFGTMIKSNGKGIYQLSPPESPQITT